MDRDTVIALARESAFHTPVTEGELLRFAALVAAHEREECAKVCNDYDYPSECAAAIRSRT